MDRRRFLHAAAGTTASLIATSTIAARSIHASNGLSNGIFEWQSPFEDVLDSRYPFALPALGYANDAIEPAIDATTMSIHHDRHHAAYVTNLNAALATQPALHGKTLRELLTGLSTLAEATIPAVRNNGGGHANHALFWKLLAPGGAKAPGGSLLTAINKDFGSVAACTTALKTAGLGQFGSGWSWLVRDASGVLRVRATPNQDTPASDGQRILIGIDVWEHAYYLKYQNRRADYLDAVLRTLNWDVIGKAFAG